MLATDRERAELPPLPTWGSPDDRMLIDIADKDALWEILDSDEGW